MPGPVTSAIDHAVATTAVHAPRPERVGVFLKLDAHVVEWFRAGGPGYQARINEVLRQFVRGVTDPDRRPDRLERAQRLYEQYHTQCFWHMRPDLVVTDADIPVIVQGLRTHGGRSGFLAAEQLCR